MADKSEYAELQYRPSSIQYQASILCSHLRCDASDPRPDKYMADHSFQITTRSIDETQRLSQKLGRLLNQPLIIALRGDLGSGKTAFVQGLAKGLEVPDKYYITSPTFTLINEYPGRLPLMHVDLYRLDNVADLEDIGLDERLYDKAVIAVEWADKLSDSLPARHLSVNMDITDDNSRTLILDATGHHEVNLLLALMDAWAK